VCDQCACASYVCLELRLGFAIGSDLHDGNNNRMESQPPTSGSLVQNFFIVLPNTGAITDMAGSAQAETVLHAIRAALGAAPPSEAQSPVRRATFDDVAREWYQNKVAGWAPSYAGRLMSRLETGLLAHLGTRPVAAISPQDVLEVIRTTEARDVRETARRILRIASAVSIWDCYRPMCARPNGCS
jgi:hypothetical protein